jgi:hypothetical protein
MEPLEQRIDNLNLDKMEMKTQINTLLKDKSDESNRLEEEKLTKIR